MSTSNRETAGLPERQRTIISVLGAVGMLFVLSYVGYLIFEDLAYSVVPGLLSGTGTYFVLDYILAGNLAEMDDGAEQLGGESSAFDRPSAAGIHLGALGFALDMSGIVVFALGMALDANLLIGLAAGVGAVVVNYVVFERMFPHPDA